MDVSDLDYTLPDGAIAQEPPEHREDARLLVDRGAGQEPQHRTAAELPDLLRAGDLLVVNDTRVLPARLRLHKATGGAVEVLLLERVEGDRWEALVRPSRKVAPGTRLDGPAGFAVEVLADRGEGRWCVAVNGDIESAGALP